MGTLRATAETRILEAPFEDRRQLAGALLPELAPGGLFVAGEHDLTAAQRVQVLVRLDGIEPGLLMAATVSWRRLGGGAGLAPAGVAVRLAGTESARFAWLRAFATSTGTDARKRLCPRFPVSIPVSFVLPHESAVQHGTLLDISEGGARLDAGPAPPGRVIVMRLRDGRPGPPAPARIVWTTGEASGLCLLTDRDDVRRFWERVIRATRADIEARLIRPRRPGPRG